MLREMCISLASVVAPDGPGLDELFEEIPPGEGPTETWVLRPKPVGAEPGRYLQGRILALAWCNDAGQHLERDGADVDGAETAKAFEVALRVGKLDFGILATVDDRAIPNDPGLATLWGAIRDVADLAQLGRDLDPLTVLRRRSMAMPLHAMVLKHLGDLCADSDRWDQALAFYRCAAARLAAFRAPAWRTLAVSLSAMAAQSEATALRALEGPKAARDLLASSLEGRTLTADAIRVTNAAKDLMRVESLTGDLFGGADRRVTLLTAPQIVGSHGLAPALANWREHRYEDAHRHFWAVLRRQTALGAAEASRHTKALYAASVFEQLDGALNRHRAAALFRTGMRLLIESGIPDGIDRLAWTEPLIRAYVDEAAIADVIAHSQRHAGAAPERLNVAVAVFQAWTLVLAPDRAALAQPMIVFICGLAAGHDVDIFTPRNLGGRSLEALATIARERPEYRGRAAGDVTEAVLGRIVGTGSWRGKGEAIKVADAFMDVLEEQDIKRIVEATLDHLAAFDPAEASWPVIQPPMRLLVSSEVASICRRDARLAARIIATIINFGLGQETEHTRMLFNLRVFDASVLQKPSVADRVREVIPGVMKRALDLRSSDAIDNVRALLLTPVLAGRAGVEAALKALSMILASGLERPRLSFAQVPDVLLLLADRRHEIAAGTGSDQMAFKEALLPLLVRLAEVWMHAIRHPVIFAQFSLPPPTAPNATTVHNWVFSSIAFAESLDDTSSIKDAIDAAAQNPELKDTIARARATRLVYGEGNPGTLDTIPDEDRETFYTSLASRLIALTARPAQDRAHVLLELLAQCFRQGPRGLDAGVFAMWLDSGLVVQRDMPNRADYVRRLNNQKDLRLALMPFLARIDKRSAP